MTVEFKYEVGEYVHVKIGPQGDSNLFGIVQIAGINESKINYYQLTLTNGQSNWYKEEMLEKVSK